MTANPITWGRSVRDCWERFMNWTPTRAQAELLGDTAWLIGWFAQNVLKCAVVLMVLYVALEVGTAFLPGGAVGRALGWHP